MTSAAGGGNGRRRGNRSNSESKVEAKAQSEAEADEALTSRIVINSAFEHSVHCTTHDTTGRRGDEQKGCKVVGQAVYGLISYSLDYEIYFFNLCTISLSSPGEWEIDREGREGKGERHRE